MTKFQKFWVPEYFLYQCTLLIKIQPMGSTIIFISIFFCSVTTLHDFLLAINSERNFWYIHSMFSYGQIMLIYAVVWRHSMWKICQQNLHECWHCYVTTRVVFLCQVLLGIASYTEYCNIVITIFLIISLQQI